jgi:putative N6-adenine-specific DNA methylase
VIEAAEIAARLNPGRGRSFAFEHLATFDAQAWARMRAVVREGGAGVVCHGRDRDAGAVAMSIANAERAGVSGITAFRQGVVSDLAPPEGPPGLVMTNPPFGTRLGDPGRLMPLYRALGRVLRERFSGWRVGLVAQEARLAQATGLPFLPPGPPVPHGGLRVTLWRTGVLP